jgi:uncharacterized membrane protein (GlpM family)
MGRKNQGQQREQETLELSHNVLKDTYILLKTVYKEGTVSGPPEDLEASRTTLVFSISSLFNYLMVFASFSFSMSSKICLGLLSRLAVWSP